jgi:hypothetical protein
MTTIVDVETPNTRWRLRVQVANDPNGQLFYAELHDPSGKVVSMTRAQPSAARAVESATTWLLVRGQTAACTALRAMADAELRQ